VLHSLESTLSLSTNHASIIAREEDIIRVLGKCLANGWALDAKSLAGLASVSCGNIGYQAFNEGTALHWAVEYNNIPAIRVLVGAGTSPYARNSRGVSPWRLAVECRLPIIKIFVELAQCRTDRLGFKILSLPSTSARWLGISLPAPLS
jgi:hypothetical protein